MHNASTMLSRELGDRNLPSILRGKLDPSWRRTIIRCTLLFAVIGLLAASLGASAWNIHFRKHVDLQSADHARMYMEHFEDSISKYVLVTGMIAGILRDQRGRIENFPELSEVLSGGDSGIIALQLAPGGVVADTSPAWRGHGGVDFFADPSLREEAAQSRDSGRTSLFGPFTIADGRMALVIRRPVYLMSSYGKPQFWGFAIAVLDPQEIFDSSDLRSSPGYRFSVKLEVSALGQNPARVVFESGRQDFRKTTCRKFFLDRTWTVSLSPDIRPWQMLPALWIFLGVWLSSILMGVAVGYTRYFLQFNRALLAVNSQLESISITDPLTGILNRSGFTNSIDNWISSHRGCSACLALIDLDDFKRINDLYGHDAGDTVLRSFARELGVEFGPFGFAAREGGDEFAIFLNEGNRGVWMQKLKAFACRRHTAEWGQQCLIFGTSAGYALCPDDASDLHRLHLM
ncbi:MAG: diguanylate cyclase domain-containing protein, partial [Succinivibrio sp.]